MVESGSSAPGKNELMEFGHGSTGYQEVGQSSGAGMGDTVGSGVRLEGKAAVVVGCGTGLGRAIAETYLREGAKVMASGRSDPGLSGIPFYRADVRDPDVMAGLMAAGAREFGQLDVVVANAGVSRPGRVAVLPPADWIETMDTNVTGTFLAIQAAVPELERSGGGRIITMSSALGTRLAPGASAYCASKAAIEMLTKVAAVELADRGITVNCLAPGIIDIGMGRALAMNTAVWEKYRLRLAMGRLGRAAEVAAAAVFLASDDSSYINGHVLEINGGLDW